MKRGRPSLTIIRSVGMGEIHATLTKEAGTRSTATRGLGTAEDQNGSATQLGRERQPRHWTTLGANALDGRDKCGHMARESSKLV